MANQTAFSARRDILHWFWLWILAAIAITVLQRSVTGQPIKELPKLPRFENRENPLDTLQHSDVEKGTLRDVIELNKRGNYETAIEVWKRLPVVDESATWKHVGMGVAHLRIGNIDDAHDHFTKAAELDRTNAAAEYFLGRLFQAKSRRVPFWYQMNDENPFRFAALDVKERVDDTDSRPGRGKTYLPHSRRYDYDLKARQHFRRAVELAPCCDLDRPIQVRQPILQLASYQTGSRSITARDLLVSLGEIDFAEKASREIGGRVASVPSQNSTWQPQSTRIETLVQAGCGTSFVLSSVNRQACQRLRRYS